MKERRYTTHPSMSEMVVDSNERQAHWLLETDTSCWMADFKTVIWSWLLHLLRRFILISWSSWAFMLHNAQTQQCRYPGNLEIRLPKLLRIFLEVWTCCPFQDDISVARTIVFHIHFDACFALLHLRAASKLLLRSYFPHHPHLLLHLNPTKIHHLSLPKQLHQPQDHACLEWDRWPQALACLYQAQRMFTGLFLCTTLKMRWLTHS